MKVSKAFPSKYLKAADVPRPYGLTITKVAMESVDLDCPQDLKPVVYFDGAQKGLVLNVTNANTLAAQYGDEMDNWPGNAVEVYSVETSFKGKPIMGLRVRVVQPATPQSQPAMAPPQPQPSGDPGAAPTQSSAPVQETAAPERFGQVDNPDDDLPF